MPQPDCVLLLVVREENGDLLLTDPKGGQHPAASGVDLWHACQKILNDPKIPRVEHVTGGQAIVEQAMTEYVESVLPPGLNKLAPGIVAGGIEALRSLGNVGHGVGLTPKASGAKRRRG